MAAELLLRQVRRLAADPPTDAELLRRFAAVRDESAFAELVRRHGPMVLGVCRRIAGGDRADDAFQAAFLVLARRAGSIRRPESLAAWLHHVARHLALRQRTDTAWRKAATLPPVSSAEPDPLDRLSARELLAAVDEEIARLSESYRLPLLLCAVEGLSQEEAAKRLGWSPGSVKGRLERGREMLRRRLARRGLAPAAGLAGLLAEGSAESAEAVGATVKAAAAFAAGAGPMTRASELAQGGLPMLTTTKWHLAVGVFLLAAGIALGAGLLRSPQDSPKGAAPAAGDKAADDRDELRRLMVERR